MQQREPDPTAQHLVELFEEQLNMSESADNMLVPSMHVKLQQSTVQPKNSAIKHSISQHYHHSNHIPIDSPIPTLRTLQHHPEDAVLHLLVQSDISPTSLLRSQLTLFEKSTPDERQKLIMLWRLAPPTFTKLGGQELADRLGEYQSTTMKQEEELAWLRYQEKFARTAEVKEMVHAERLCGKQSLLGDYIDASGSAIQRGLAQRENQSKLHGTGDEDVEMVC